MTKTQAIYYQANYLSWGYFRVYMHCLPDGKRREIIKIAKQDIDGVPRRLDVLPTSIDVSYNIEKGY